MNRETLKASKTQRHWRGLAFEQVESRLALSAASALDVSGPQLQWDRDSVLAAYQGGFVDLDLRSTLTNALTSAATTRDQPILMGDSFDINLREWIQFESGLGAYDSTDFTTIPQPGMGPMRPDGGMIAIGEIFAIAPLVKMGNDTEEVAQVARGEFESSEVSAASEERLSLSRARDVYFDVAARAEVSEFERPDRAIRTAGAVASAQLATDEGLTQKSDSLSIAALVARGRSLPAAQNTLSSEPVQLRDVAKPLREAPSMTQSPDSESKSEKVAQPKQVSQSEFRDEVFQAWRDPKLDVMKRTPDRTEEEEHDDSTSWPVLAALAVGGLVFTSRRLVIPASTQQLLPRKKSLGFSRLEG